MSPVYSVTHVAGLDPATLSRMRERGKKEFAACASFIISIRILLSRPRSRGADAPEAWAPFRDAWLRDFFMSDIRAKRIPADLQARLFMKLQMLDDATIDADLRVPPSNHFEKLRGGLAGRRSIRVNEQWRLVFRWNGATGEASEVYLDDHSYR